MSKDYARIVKTITGAPVTLGATTYQVEIWVWNDDTTTTWLTGPRGARYSLRPLIARNGDTGTRQVISQKNGAPLRHRGNEIRVIVLGDKIEQATN